MSLIYRAIWNDDGLVATQHLLDHFVTWCRGKGFDQHPDNRPVETSAPRLVRQLIAEGVNPTRSGVSLLNRPRIVGPNDVHKVFEALSSEKSSLPVVIFSADKRSLPETTIERAEKAAEALCGIAQVFALSPQAGLAFERLIPTGFHTYGGAVRVYLPKVNFEDPTDSTRHR